MLSVRRCKFLHARCCQLPILEWNRYQNEINYFFEMKKMKRISVSWFLQRKLIDSGYERKKQVKNSENANGIDGFQFPLLELV